MFIPVNNLRAREAFNNAVKALEVAKAYAVQDNNIEIQHEIEAMLGAIQHKPANSVGGPLQAHEELDSKQKDKRDAK